MIHLTPIHFLFALLTMVHAAATSLTGPQGVTLQGSILNPQGLPETGANVVFTVDVRSPGPENCLLYRETHTLNMYDSDGNFSFILGFGNRTGTTFDATSTLAQVFNNAAGILAGLECTTGTSYTPFSGQQRNIMLTFNDGTSTQTLTAPLNVMAVPYALTADTLQGHVPSDFLNLGTETNLTQTNVESLFSSTNYPKLTTLLNTTGILTVGADGALTIPSVVTDPSSASEGQLWFNSTERTFNYFDGSAVETIGTLQSLSSVSGNAILSGTISGSTAISTSGNLQTTGSLSASQEYFYDHSGRGPGYVGITVPANIAASGGQNYLLTLPINPGASGQVLTTDGTGVLSWTNRSVGAVTSVTGVAPISISGTSQAPVINVSAATTAAAGVVTLAASGTTTAGTVVQATDSRLSDSRAPAGVASGDLSGSYPGPTVAQIRGVAVSTTGPTTAGQMLRFDGTKWTPNFVSMSDLRSIVTGSQTFAAGCLFNQTLTWMSTTDSLACNNIAIGDSQITYGIEAANTLLAGPTTGSAAPTFRPLAASDLPAGGYNSTYFKNGSNSFGTAAVLGTADNNSLSVQTSGATRMTILSGGNVGIGITNPSTALQVTGTITATTFAGALSGNATTATAATSATTAASATNTAVTAVTTNASFYPTFVNATTGNLAHDVSTGLTFNPSTNTLTTTTFSGALSGNATSATNTAVTAVTTNASFYPTFVNATTGILAHDVATGLTFNPSTSTLTTSNFAGTATNATNTAVTAVTTNASFYPTFVSTTTGNLAHDVSTGLTFNPSTNTLTTTTFAGAVTGHASSDLSLSGGAVTGNLTVSGTVGIGGHINNSGTAATMGTCGTSPSIAGNDTRGTVTVGTGTVTSCAVTFQSSFASTPFCTVSWASTPSTTGISALASTSALTVSFSASAPGLKFTYICMQ